MNKEHLLSLGLTEEQANEVLKGFEGYVPRDRFNEVNEAKKTAEALVTERDKQISQLKKSEGASAELQAQIEQLQKSNKEAQAKYEADLKALKISNAIDNLLTSGGAKNLKATRALLDMGKITLDGDEVKGLSEQIEALKTGEDTKFLFGETKTVGTKGGEGSDSHANKTYAQMTYSERVAYLANGGTPE